MIAVYIFHVIFGIFFIIMVVAMFFDLPNKIFKKNDNDDDKDRKE